MNVQVHWTQTSFPWFAFGDYHPRRIRVTDCGMYERLDGLMVDDGTKLAGAVRKESRPFSFYVRRDLNREEVAIHVWNMIEANENLVGVVFDVRRN